jgi:rubrerythrin
MTKTQENLLKAFAGESQARNKYLMFAKMARKQEMEWVARVFEETADNERVHAQELFELIIGPVKTMGDLGIVPFSEDIMENLRVVADGEKFEWTTMYVAFAETAKEEGAIEAERLFRALITVEQKHEERYVILARDVENKTIYKRETEVEWKCLNCGYVHKGTMPPEKCPLCQKPKGWYMEIGLLR